MKSNKQNKKMHASTFRTGKAKNEKTTKRLNKKNKQQNSVEQSPGRKKRVLTDANAVRLFIGWSLDCLRHRNSCGRASKAQREQKRREKTCRMCRQASLDKEVASANGVNGRLSLCLSLEWVPSSRRLASFHYTSRTSQPRRLRV